MTKLYLVRHGETFDNERQIMQGQTQGELNLTGIRQAEALSRQLADEHFDAVVASDLWRAVQTAQILAEPHHLPVVITPLLRERDWGSFTGRFIPGLKDIKPWPDDIESLPMLISPFLLLWSRHANPEEVRVSLVDSVDDSFVILFGELWLVRWRVCHNLKVVVFYRCTQTD